MKLKKETRISQFFCEVITLQIHWSPAIALIAKLHLSSVHGRVPERIQKARIYVTEINLGNTTGLDSRVQNILSIL